MTSRLGRMLRAARATTLGVFGGFRTRIVLGYIGLLAVAAVASILVAREVLVARLDERIDAELVQETRELRRLSAEGIDPDTGNPLRGDVAQLFRAYLERNVPSRNEVLLSFVGGQPFLRSAQLSPYALDEDRTLVERWGSLRRTDRGRVATPAGDVDYLATPLKVDGTTRGVFVVAIFRDREQEEVDAAIVVVAAVGLAMLLIGSVLAWRLAEGVIRPVSRVTRTARELTETDLSRRIPVQGNDEVAELAGTFNAMLDRLERAFSTQRRFLDDAGHELRTPITIVRGHLELLGDDLTEREQTLELVLDEIERMSRMVDDLIVLARAGRPDFLRRTSVELSALTDTLFTKAKALGRRRWRLDASAVGEFVADTQRLTQAVMQLAQNAVAHTSKRQVVALGSARANGEIRIWVRDEGAGVPRSEQERIFDRFVRFSSGRLDGTGLGLSIVRAIAEAHGGRVEVNSRLGEGAMFTLVIPAELHRSRRS